MFLPGLNFTLEYSAVNSEFNINTTKDISSSFSHYSQSLGPVLGSGFKELYVQLNYHYKRVRFLISLNYADRNIVDAQRWGFIDADETLPLNESYNANSIILNTELAYRFNPKTNMEVAGGYQLKRSGLNTIFGKTDYLYIAFRTTLFNQYLDF